MATVGQKAYNMAQQSDLEKFYGTTFISNQQAIATYPEGEGAATHVNRFLNIGKVSQGTMYHLQVQFNNVNGISRKDNIKIYLYGAATQSSDEGRQLLNKKSYVLPIGESSPVYDIIFTPNAPDNAVQYNILRFEIDRDISIDPNLVNFDINVVSLTPLKDVKGNEIGNNIKRLGIIGPPNMWFVINDQALRLSDSGYFELMSEAVKIDSLCFAPKLNDAFLVDYVTA